MLRTTSTPSTGLGSLIIGLGMGLLSVSSLVLIQELVDRPQRGSATASNLFARNIGSTLGATVLGAVLNFGLSHANDGKPVTSDQIRRLLGEQTGATPTHTVIGAAFQQSLNLTFWAMLAISLAIVFVAMRVPPVGMRQAAEVPAE